MNPKNTIRVGIIGCGNISQAYFNGAERFEVLEIAACADLNPDAAEMRAKEHGCAAKSVDALLADPEVDMVVNLTIPAAHAEINLKALRAGKHVYCEKPFAVSLDDAKSVLAEAEGKGLLAGGAPDTFLGGGLQTCRKLVDDGWIGRVTGGTAFMLSRGPDSWHPNPGFFYQPGGGPMFDMGPYYLTALVHLLGPVRRVCAVTSKAFEKRMATSAAAFGTIMPVEVETHHAGVLEFHSGAVISMVMSFDVYAHGHKPITLFGTEGSLEVPDPNQFGGPVGLWAAADREWRAQALSHPYTDNVRGIGAADMARAVLSGRKPRANGELTCHVLEVMHAFEKSSTSGAHVVIASQPERPAALPQGLVEGLLD